MDRVKLEVAKALHEEAKKKLQEYAESLIGLKILGFRIRKFYREDKDGKKIMRLKADKTISKKLYQVSIPNDSNIEEIEERISNYIKDKGLEEILKKKK